MKIAAFIALWLALFMAASPVQAQALPDTIRSSTLTRAQEQEMNRRLASLQGRFEMLAQETRLREVAVRNIAVEIFGARPDLDLTTYVALIDNGARELRAYITDARGRSENDPTMAALRQRAIAAAEEGRLTDARRLYDDLIDANRVMRTARRDTEDLADSNDIAESARLAYIAGDFRGAADRYDAAAELAPTGAQRRRWELRVLQGFALYEHGVRFESGALIDAQHIFADRALVLVPRATAPLEWAQTQMNLGATLQQLGARQDGAQGIATLGAARRAYERALEVIARADNPSEWATAQLNLGTLLVSLGERQEGSDSLAALRAAARAYEQALTVRTRTANAAEWAKVQWGLANVLQAMGVRQSGVEGLTTLEAARAGYERALEAVTSASDARTWASIEMNFGNLLLRLGERQNGQEGLATLQAARAAYEQSLEVSTRASDARSWALIQNSLGYLEETIGDRGGGEAAYARAIQRYRWALEVYNTGGDEIGRQRAQTNLARVITKRR